MRVWIFLGVVMGQVVRPAYAAPSVCPNADHVPQAMVKFVNQPTQYSEAFPSTKLKEMMQGNPDSTLATDSRSVVFGVTSSQTRGNVRVEFTMRINPQTGEECLYIDSALYEITYAPSVFVSSDILGMACSYETTRTHEQQHVAIDYKAMQDYLPHIKRDMQVYLNSFGYKGFGPYDVKHSQTYRDKLAAQVNAATKPMLERLKEERRKNQGRIDTPENYALEAARCPQDRVRVGR